ncbi:MAG: response regulator transcription factor [Solirubrobacteraceae bacterium]
MLVSSPQSGFCSSLSTPLGVPVLVVDDSLKAIAWTDGARTWVDSGFPGLVRALADQLAAREERCKDGPATVIVEAEEGWLAARAARLSGAAGRAGLVITIAAATPEETVSALGRTRALTPREEEIVKQLLRGASTRALAQTLFISPHTVQDHFKSIFAKLGISSRRELVARLMPPSAGVGAAPSVLGA